MQAKVTKEFPGRPDNEPLSRAIKAGEIIGGDLAAVAVREGWADALPEEGTAIEQADDGLDGMTAGQLKAFAAERGIDLGDATKKADIRATIDLALEAAK